MTAHPLVGRRVVQFEGTRGTDVLRPMPGTIVEVVEGVCRIDRGPGRVAGTVLVEHIGPLLEEPDA